MPRTAVIRPCGRTTSHGITLRALRAAGDTTGARRARPRPALGVAAIAALSLLSVAGTAAAQSGEGTGGFSPQTPPAAGRPAPDAAPSPVALAPSPTADLYGGPAPHVTRVTCRTACDAPGAARPGSLVRVYGRNLTDLGEVVFFGVAADPADDASVAPRSTTRRSVLVRVPRTAVTGRIALARVDGTRSRASRSTLSVASEPLPLPAGVIDAEVQDHKVFFGAQRRAQLSYVVGGDEPASVQVELVRASDGLSIAQWAPGLVAPGVPRTIEWDGTIAGRLQPDGLYQFRVTATDASGVRATSSQVAGPIEPEAPGAFTFLGYRFPILGAHDFGEFAASFGGGRGHQGHDVFAACGTPLVAARGGVVQFKQYHSRAGYYIVIDGERTGTDYAYMHMREAALVAKGDRVRTGQLLGYVGATGRASGCHLHFEEWSAPGWYSGGKPFDPLPDLRAWDAQS